jgi:hypothetical protein
VVTRWPSTTEDAPQAHVGASCLAAVAEDENPQRFFVTVIVTGLLVAAAPPLSVARAVNV